MIRQKCKMCGNDCQDQQYNNISGGVAHRQCCNDAGTPGNWHKNGVTRDQGGYPMYIAIETQNQKPNGGCRGALRN
jgi:hypothetical protein